MVGITATFANQQPLLWQLIPLHFDLSGLHAEAWFSQGISTYLKPLSCSDPPLSARCNGLTLPKLATGLAKPLFSRVLRRPLYQVVSPTPQEDLAVFLSSPDSRGLPHEDKGVGLAVKIPSNSFHSKVKLEARFYRPV
jgi:hypothetical protein